MSKFFPLQICENMVLCKRFISIKNMIYTSKYINFISLIIAIVIFFMLNILFMKTSNISVKNISNYIPKIEFKKEKAVSKVKQEVNDEELEKWYIEIPKINLKAPIENGTDL